MAIPKIKGKPFTDIRDWLWERKKTIIPNPLKPWKTKTIDEKELDANKLQKTLIGFKDKIDKIIDELNKLTKTFQKIKPDIIKFDQKLKIIDKQLKMKTGKTHTHMAMQVGQPTGRPQGRKGGSVKRMKQGGSSSQCIKHQMPDGTIMNGPPHGPNQTCIEWSSGNYQSGGRFTKPVTTSMSDLKQKLIDDIKKLQNTSG